MFYFASNYNSDAIFVFPGVDLYKRILISNQNSDLKISASSTYRIFLWSKNKVSRIFLASGKSMTYDSMIVFLMIDLACLQL